MSDGARDYLSPRAGADFKRHNAERDSEMCVYKTRGKEFGDYSRIYAGAV